MSEPFLELAHDVLGALEDKKAVELKVLDLRKVATYADLLVICSGTSSTHVQALVDNVEDRVPESPTYINRSPDSSWCVLDYIDVVVHVFRGDLRERYDLETLWADARPLDRTDL